VRGVKHTAAGTDLHVGQRPGGHRGAGLLVGGAPRILLVGTVAHQGGDRLSEICSDPFVVCFVVGHDWYVCGPGDVCPHGNGGFNRSTQHVSRIEAPMGSPALSVEVQRMFWSWSCDGKILDNAAR